MGRISIALSAVPRGKVLHFRKTTGTFAVLTMMLTGVAAHADEKIRSELSSALFQKFEAELAVGKADNAVMKVINDWQQYIIEVARTDPEEALRQRLPMSVCLATSIAPKCGEMTDTFVPDK